jgi:hypothetical protein
MKTVAGVSVSGPHTSFRPAKAQIKNDIAP